MTVLFAGAFLAGATLVTMVVPLLASLDSLTPLVLSFTVFAAAGWAAFLPLLVLVGAAVFVVEGAVFFRVAAARVDLALSTMLVRILAAPPAGIGAAGFKGETGRAK